MSRPIAFFALVMLLALFAVNICTAQDTTVYKCKSDDGSTVFSDRACAKDAEKVSVTPLPRGTDQSPVAKELRSPTARQNESREQDTLPPAFSFLCVPATGQEWYQHDPCPKHLRRATESDVFMPGPVGVITADGFAPAVGGGGTATIETHEYVPIEQVTVTTKEACDNGAPNQSNVYKFEHGPCSFVGRRLRRQAQHIGR